MKNFDCTRDDFLPKQRSNKRRDLLAFAGTAGAIVLAARVGAQAEPDDKVGGRPAACVLTPEQTEGPYFVDERLNRSDIRSDPATGVARPGAALTLALRVRSVAGSECAPLSGAIVDLWHCDAEGRYSDVPDRRSRVTGEKFLRGYQVTDGNGAVRFTTIFPGWYPGRAVHIHFKVRAQRASQPGVEFTSQLYFDEAIIDQVLARAPYARTGRRTKNVDDGIFSDGGRQLLLTPRERGAGFAAAFDLGVRLG